VLPTEISHKLLGTAHAMIFEAKNWLLFMKTGDQFHGEGTVIPQSMGNLNI